MAPLTASPAGVAPSETGSGRALAGAASQSPYLHDLPTPCAPADGTQPLSLEKLCAWPQQEQ